MISGDTFSIPEVAFIILGPIASVCSRYRPRDSYRLDCTRLGPCLWTSHAGYRWIRHFLTWLAARFREVIGNFLGVYNYDSDWFRFVREGRIRVHIAEIMSLSLHTIELSDRTTLKADALICCSGWKAIRSVEFLPTGLEEQMGYLGHFTRRRSCYTQYDRKY
ncbi:hypothetical protein N7532_004893 [Penicillium argentinense]|uniref:Uncharacterized protein n=1 Tax=Penicillium argentinense TaxID=1131581 RepID=A0A9W9KAE6_9EURO|nr:uncharacterized protein N7532_004893 [Penicillium argentinense]KAJ5097892.1 hypothetical protein N7532_004893 [Penicillium argentinense]